MLFRSQLHCNELPLRHLVEHLDGPTSGPRALSGPLALSKREPGTMSHSRWLTTANRLLRLYVATADPSDSLKTLVRYVVTVYAQMWFSIKNKPSCKDGSRHLWQTIRLSRYLPDDLRKVVDTVLSRNGYFGHPENLLLGLITNDRKHIRELGLRRILKARSEHNSVRIPVRVFTVPEINFNAEDYTELINWQSCNVTEPPLTVNISDVDITAFVKSKESPVVDFPRFPCHTQAVERCIKLVTEASAAVCGNTSRDGFIRAGLEARSIMPVFNTKSEYRVK